MSWNLSWRTGWTKVLVALLVALPLVGCSLVPDSGPVHRRATSVDTTSPEAPYFDPPGPVTGAGPAEIVTGFLTAMQANPISPAAARMFLSDHARQNWRPDGGTIVYDASTVQQHGARVLTRLSDAHDLDARGSWSATPTQTRSMSFRLVKEKGQWRIDNPLNALMVRSSYFQSQFVPYNLYFFDHSGRVLVPDPVYLPIGEQTATSLVRGLLSGPDPALASVVRTSFPATTALDLSVVVTDSGVAEVPLGPEVLRLSPDELNRAMIQLAWTLHQVAGINRVRITVDGAPVPLPDRRTDLSVDEGSEFDPSGLGASRELIGVRSGRVVTLTGSAAQPVSGGLGKGGFALRSVALDRSGDKIAAVSGNGANAYTASTSASSHRVNRALEGGQDLLRPAYDLFGNLWLVDRTSAGAVIHVVRNGKSQVVRFPGITGRSLTSFAVSPDGTHLAVGLLDKVRPRVSVATILRGPGGTVLRGLKARALPVASYDPIHELGPVADVGWRTPTLLAVLTHSSPAVSRVVYAMYDGSPGSGEPPLPDAFSQTAAALVVNADNGLPLMLLDGRGRLARLDAAGKWEATGPTKLSAAAYAN